MSGNTGLSGNNIYLRAAHPAMTVTGALTNGASLYVTSASGIHTITAGYSDHNTAHPGRFIHADSANYGIALAEGEAKTDQVINAVPYVKHSWNGSELTTEYPFADEARAVPSDGNMTGGWYCLNSNVARDGRIESITGDVNLILGDGCTLNVKGLYVPAGSTLTIYGQAGGTGKIVSTPSGGAGIGGYDGHDSGSIVIHGGVIEAHGYDNCAGIGSNSNQTTGNITLYGGSVTADSRNNGAGIGAGRNSDGGTITIYGGTVTATGATSSAGIGGGDASGSYADSSTIIIYGGTVTATGDEGGAGIGGGEYGHVTVTIYGGSITATGGDEGGAGIGSGADGAGSTVTITGGTVSASSAGSGGFGIGDGKNKTGSTVSLGYTEATREGVSITASSFKGTVTLAAPFAMHSSGRLFPAGTLSDTGLLSGGALTWWNGEVADWQTLQKVINGASGGAVFTLGMSYYADNDSDMALHVPGGSSITIDLNGYAIDRNLAESDAREDGYVIKNEGTLTITDSSTDQTGTITGGNCRGNAGGIYNTGTLTLSGGTISGNRATGSGGGINNAGTLTVSGGSIAGNSAAHYHGGGIYNSGTLTLKGGSVTGNSAPAGQGGGVLNNGTMNVSDAPVVSGNTAASGNNIYLRENHAVMNVTGPLTEGAKLWVTVYSRTGTVTSGFTAEGWMFPGRFILSDDETLYVKRKNREAYITDESTAVSSWEDLDDAIQEGDNTILAKDITATDDDPLLHVPQGTAAKLDLNGHTLDVHALWGWEIERPGYFLLIEGSFTLTDSIGGGAIKGGDESCADVIKVANNGSFTMNGGTITGFGNKLDDTAIMF